MALEAIMTKETNPYGLDLTQAIIEVREIQYFSYQKYLVVKIDVFTSPSGGEAVVKNREIKIDLSTTIDTYLKGLNTGIKNAVNKHIKALGWFEGAKDYVPPEPPPGP